MAGVAELASNKLLPKTTTKNILAMLRSINFYLSVVKFPIFEQKALKKDPPMFEVGNHGKGRED